MNVDHRAYWVWLQHALNSGSSKPRHILSVYPSLRAFYEAGEMEWRVAGIFTQREISAMCSYSPEHAASLIVYCERLGQSVVTPEDEAYPRPLLEIHSPPCALYVKGTMPDFVKTPSLSIVGARKATQSGKHAANSLAYSLAKAGMVIVSGGALGIDTEAHKGALLANGKTVCVLGCGIGVNYLMENASMREAISHSGAVISEYPPDTPVNGRNFPIRNRIISGLTLGTLVVEAAAKSGSLITANYALEQNRDVFALPGSIGSTAAHGANDLLKDGAKLVSCANDVLVEYQSRFPGQIRLEESEGDVVRLVEQQEPEEPEEPREEPPQDVSPEAQALYRVLTNRPCAAVELSAQVGIPISQFLAATTELEICGKIRSYSGKRYSR